MLQDGDIFKAFQNLALDKLELRKTTKIVKRLVSVLKHFRHHQQVQSKEYDTIKCLEKNTEKGSDQWTTSPAVSTTLRDGVETFHSLNLQHYDITLNQT